MLAPDQYPVISVVIPSFNQGLYIEETLLSIIGQQYPNLELIVIDGGSTDNTVEILQQYSSQLSYWHSKQDQGQADAINQGMTLSSGDILCWLNSDDMYLPGTLLDIGKRFQAVTKEYHLLYGATAIIKQTENELNGGVDPSAPFDSLRLTCSDYIVQPSAFWTRKLWCSTGELNINYNYVLDWEWFIRASKITDFEYVPKFYSVYRLHQFHKTSQGGSQRRKEIVDVVNKFSSSYWIDLYTETERCYDQLIKVKKKLIDWKVPKAHLILLFLFPKLLSKFKNMQDFSTVVRMLGS